MASPLLRARGARRQPLDHRPVRLRAIALAVLDLIPPPFPFMPFVLAAGALGVNATTFFVTLTVRRLVRFGIEALLGALYGRDALVGITSDLFRDIVALCIVLAIVASIVSTARVIRATRTRMAHG